MQVQKSVHEAIGLMVQYRIARVHQSFIRHPSSVTRSRLWDVKDVFVKLAYPKIALPLVLIGGRCLAALLEQ